MAVDVYDLNYSEGIGRRIFQGQLWDKHTRSYLKKYPEAKAKGSSA
jgi:hypothetical protein